MGKWGFLFFFHFAEYTKASLFSDYAMDLISGIQEQIHATCRADYERGIAGIGVGINYLCKYNFLKVSDDTFDYFDERMHRAVMYEPYPDFSLHSGLTGYGRYWLTRFFSYPKSRKYLDYISCMLVDNIYSLSEEDQTDAYLFLSDYYNISKTSKQLKNLNYFKNNMNVIKTLSNPIQLLKVDLGDFNQNMGLLKGYAGEGMRKLLILKEIGEDWIKLL